MTIEEDILLRVYESETFSSWLRKLKDAKAKAQIEKQIHRIKVAEAYVGDWKPIGGGIVEIRIDSGPGYRLYTVMECRKLLILLAGGTKQSQSRDIAAAKRELMKWRRLNDGTSTGF